jgi:hypothetical protein
MVCQYSTRGLVSSEKHEAPSGVEGRGADTLGGVIAAEVMAGYGPMLEPPEVVSRAAKVAKTFKLRTSAKLYVHETLLDRLPQDLEDMAAELRQFIQEVHPVVRERPLTRQW